MFPATGDVLQRTLETDASRDMRAGIPLVCDTMGPLGAKSREFRGYRSMNELRIRQTAAYQGCARAGHMTKRRAASTNPTCVASSREPGRNQFAVQYAYVRDHTAVSREGRTTLWHGKKGRKAHLEGAVELGDEGPARAPVGLAAVARRADVDDVEPVPLPTRLRTRRAVAAGALRASL
jgi:hypothetical protein